MTTYCKRNHAIRSSQDRLPNRECRQCNRDKCRERQRRNRAAWEAIREHKLEALLQIAS